MTRTAGGRTSPVPGPGVALRRRRLPPGSAADSPYGRIWGVAAALAAVVWAVVALVQSQPLPLLLVVVALSCSGGLFFVKASRATSAPLRRYASGVLVTAACVLVTVGIGHHIQAGLATVAVLIATSPAVLRWIARP